MKYIVLFSLSILVDVLTDSLIFHKIAHFNKIFLMLFCHLFIFISITLVRRTIPQVKPFNIFHGISNFIAFLLTYKAYDQASNVLEVSTMYYSIPIFEAIILFFINRKINILSVLFFGCVFFLFIKKVPYIGLCGCLCFAISNIILSYYGKNVFEDIRSSSFVIAICSGLCILFWNIKTSFSMLINPFLWLTACLILLSNFLYVTSYEKEDPLKLAPFRFVDVIFLNILNFKVRILPKLITIIFFMIVKMIY